MSKNENSLSERESETLDKLYLEWSQFTNAKTWRDLVNEERIAELEAEVERLREDRDTWKEVTQDICEEWTEDCDTDCNSYGHTEGCKATSIAAAKRALTDRAYAAEAKLRSVGSFMASWRERDFDLPPYTKGVMDGRHQCAEELEALLKGDT